MAIKAPFRFARINRWVHFPEPAVAVSHDLPFRDGISGEIRFWIIARTPLLVGGPRRGGVKKNEERNIKASSGEVWPFTTEDGNWAIPGTSLQGLTRAMLEVASFGKLGPVVAKRRFGVRDIQEGATASELYRSRVVGKVKPGWLVKEGNGVCVFACSGEVGRIRIDEIGDKLGLLPPARHVLTTRSDAKKRLMAITGSVQSCDLSKLDTDLEGVDATLVLTGKTQEGLGDRAKKEEFLFHNPSRSQAHTGKRLEVLDNVWQDFLLIHDQNTGKNAQPNPNWEFWKPHFQRGEAVPVFYLGDDTQVTDMGTAQMFKLAMALSTHALLKNSTEKHLDTELFDLPALIFGATGEKDGKDSWYAHNLKRRASFDMARGPKQNAEREIQTNPEVLLSPKPNYYPIYVRQAPRTDNRIEAGKPYAAYHKMPGPDAARTRPELSGVKIWPANGRNSMSAHDDRTAKQEPIRNYLNLVPAGTKFEGRLRIHNLRPFEVGALLWALTFGDKMALNGMETPLRHRLGAVKPLGAGEVEVRISSANLLSNGGEFPPDLNGLVETYTGHMQTAYAERKPGASWLKSPQVQGLLKAAEPSKNDEVAREYMQLGDRKDASTYVGARAEHYFLNGYSDSPDHEIGVAGPSEFERIAADAIQQFPGREKPPAEHPDHPAADAFNLGDRVKNSANNTVHYIVAYPKFRPHPLEPTKVKWGTCRVAPNGTFSFEDVQQGKLTKI